MEINKQEEATSIFLKALNDKETGHNFSNETDHFRWSTARKQTKKEKEKIEQHINKAKIIFTRTSDTTLADLSIFRTDGRSKDVKGMSHNCIFIDAGLKSARNKIR